MSLVSGPTIDGKRAFSASMTRAGVVDRQRRLGDVGELVGIGDVRAARPPRRCEIRCTLAGDLADRALDLGVAGMADQDDLAALGGVALALVVHLGDQRAGGVDHRQAALARRGSRPRLATPWALKIVIAPGGISSSSSTKRAPLARSRSTTWRLCTISCRT